MKYLRITTLGLVMALLAGGLIACGGGGSTPPAANNSQSSAMATSLTLGDAPADNIVSYEITITSITLTGPKTINALTAARRLELTHLSATVEPISTLSIDTAGTYTATIAWSSPEVTFLNAVGAPVEVQSTASGTVQVPNISVTAASVLNFDVNVAQSVTVNPAAGTATFNTPVFTQVARGMAEAEREEETGEIEDMVGTVTASSATSVTINSGKSGNSMTFTVNANTQLQGVTSAAQLVAGQVVRVEGTSQANSDGSVTFIAKEIEAESADGNGAEAEGLVTSVGATSFTMIVDDASGASTSTSDLGKTVSVDASRASFSIGKTKISTGGVPGISFASIADLHKGQRVEADSDTPKSAGAGTVSDDGSFSGAKKVKLQQQALTGTIAAPSGSNFTLNISTDSAFFKLTGLSSVSVVGSGAQMKNGVTVTAGATVRVRGLLFANVAGTSYTLVAGRITTP